jgi:preprotein translocase subunit SecG
MLILEILLSVIMVFNCVILVCLVLMQLPKKEAGAGLAFGGGTTDALFGAGSGNFLTKATKYAAGIFFVLAILLSVLQSARAHRPGSQFMEKIKEQQNAQPAMTAPPPPATTTPAAQPTNAVNTNTLLINPLESTTNNAAPANMPNNAAPTNPAPQK